MTDSRPIGGEAEFTWREMRATYRVGMEAAARLVCRYCDRGRPRPNEEGISVHRTFSSRGLGTDHECYAQAIYDAIDADQKAEVAAATEEES